jgi:WD40 repeat protein
MRIECVTFSPDGRTLATCAEGAKLWDAATGKLQRLLFTCGDPRTIALGFRVNCVRFKHREGVVATAGSMVPVQLWEPASGQELLRLTFWSGQTESIAFSADDRLLATANNAGDVRLFQTRTGKMLELLTGHAGRVWCVAFAPDSRLLATAGKDGTVQLWDPDDRQNRKTLPSPPRSCLLAFSPDGKRLIAGGTEKHEGRLSIWEVPSGRLASTWPTSNPITELALAPDGRTLATGHVTGLVTVWDLDKGQPRLTFQAIERTGPDLNYVSDLAFTHDGKTLLTNGSGRVLQWDVSTGTLQRALTPANVPHWGLAYCPRGNLVATNTPDGLALWDLASGSSQTLPWTGPGSLPRLHAFSPDGTILAGCSDSNVFLWDVAARRAGPPLLGHRGRVRQMVFSPDGKTLASLSMDGEVKLWSVLTGQELLSLEGHPSARSVAFSPDGRMFALSCDPEGSNNGEVYLWLPPEGPPAKAPRTSGANGTAP